MSHHHHHAATAIDASHCPRETIASFIARTWPEEIELLVGDPATAYIGGRDEAALMDASDALGLAYGRDAVTGARTFDPRLMAAVLPQLP